MAAYDAFISYSHEKDKPIAAALQSAVQKLGKPWYRRRALRLFRDDTSLSATPHLWPSIEQALNQSRYFILLASPEAAASKWVNKEVAHWLDHNSIETLLIGVTDGDLTWDETTGEFATGGKMLLPPVLARRFPVEPKWVDLRAYREGSDKAGAKFTEFAADFAAAIHGVPKEDLLSQEVRQQRRALTLAWSAAGSLLILAVLATAAGVLAYRAQQEAVAQRNRAERTLSAATETASGLVRDIAVRLRNIAGIPSTLVKDILDRAKELQDQLIGAGESSTQLRRSQSLALTETSITLATLGDLNGALETARQAHAILQELVLIEPENGEWQRALAFSKGKIGDYLLKAGKLDEALVLYREALAICQLLVARDGSNSQWQVQLAVSFGNLSYAHRLQGNGSEALAAAQSALSVRRELVAKEPDNSERQLQLTFSYGNLGLVFEQLGRLDDALASFRERIALAQALMKKEPSNLEVRKSLWFGTMHMGNVFKEQGKNNEAVSMYRDARGVAQAVVEMDAANTDWQRTLLDSNERLGDMLLVVDDIDEALSAYREANTIAKTLVAKDSGNLDWQRDLAVSNVHIGDVLIRQDKLDEALAAYREGKAVFEMLVAKDPNNTNWQQSLGFATYRVGDALKAQNNFEEALVAYRECVVLTNEMAEKYPGNPTWLHDLGRCHAKTGYALQAQRKLEEALDSYRAAKSSFVVIVAKDPSDSWWQRDLALSEEEIGQALFELNRYDDSIAEYQASVAIFKSLLAKEPDSAQWQADLRRVIKPLANGLLQAGKPEQALTSLDEPLHFSPDDVFFLWDRARAQLYAGRIRAAADHFAEVVKLRPADPYNVMWLHIARVRAGNDDRDELNSNLEKLDRSRWPWLVAAFYAGLENSKAVIDAARSNEDQSTRSGQACDANFYVGIDRLDKGAQAEARQLLEDAATTCPIDFFERSAAVMELKRLDGTAMSQARP
jgi:tetratricopeptide (TPR) repeat protein